MDRAYMDFKMLNDQSSKNFRFVTRLKSNIKYTKLDERVLPDNRHQYVLVDEYVELVEPKTKEKYPKKLRRVVIYNSILKA